MALRGYNPKAEIGFRQAVLVTLAQDEGYDVVLEQLKEKCNGYRRRDYAEPCRIDIAYMEQNPEAFTNPPNGLTDEQLEGISRQSVRDMAAQTDPLGAQVTHFCEAFGLRLTRIPWQQRDTIISVVAMLVLVSSVAYVGYYYDLRSILLQYLVRHLSNTAGYTPRDPAEVVDKLKQLYPDLDFSMFNNATRIYNETGLNVPPRADPNAAPLATQAVSFLFQILPDRVTGIFKNQTRV